MGKNVGLCSSSMYFSQPVYDMTGLSSGVYSIGVLDVVVLVVCGICVLCGWGKGGSWWVAFLRCYFLKMLCYFLKMLLLC